MQGLYEARSIPFQSLLASGLEMVQTTFIPPTGDIMVSTNSTRPPSTPARSATRSRTGPKGPGAELDSRVDALEASLAATTRAQATLKGQVTKLRTAFNAQPDSSAADSEVLATLQERHDKLERNINTMTAQLYKDDSELNVVTLTAFESELTTLKTETVQIAESLRRVTSQLEARVTGHDEQLADIHEQLARQYVHAEGIASRVVSMGNAMNARIDSVESGHKADAQRFDTIESAIESLQDRMTNTEQHSARQDQTMNGVYAEHQMVLGRVEILEVQEETQWGILLPVGALVAVCTWVILYAGVIGGVSSFRRFFAAIAAGFIAMFVADALKDWLDKRGNRSKSNTPSWLSRQYARFYDLQDRWANRPQPVATHKLKWWNPKRWLE